MFQEWLTSVLSYETYQHMINHAEAVARVLLQTGAVQLSPAKQFTFASGKKSPIYCDHRLLIGCVAERALVIDALKESLVPLVSAGSVQLIAGTATAGIPWAAWVADRLKLPMVYVRGEAKEHGKGKVIEGRFEPGLRAIVLEDLVTTGDSALKSVEHLRAAGLLVDTVQAVFTYGFPTALERFGASQVKLSAILNLQVLLKVAGDLNGLPTDQIHLVEEWQKNG